MKLLCVILLLISGMVQAADVSLSWDASPTPGCSYVVWYGACKAGMPPDYTHRKNAGRKLQTTIHRLKDNTLYYFAVTARMSGQEGPFSNEIAVSTQLPHPSSPKNLKGSIIPTWHPNNICRGSR